MIELTRLNGNRLAVNGDLIQFAEAAPDTMLTMVTGEKMLVMESLAVVEERMREFRARTLADAARMSPGGLIPVAGPAMGAALRAVEHARTKAAEEGEDESEGTERKRAWPGAAR